MSEKQTKPLGIICNKTYILKEFRKKKQQLRDRFKKNKNENNMEYFNETENTKVQALLPEVIIEMRSHRLDNSPSWILIYQNTLFRINEIKNLEKEIIKLSNERIKVKFENNDKIDRQMFDSTSKVMEKIHECERNIKEITEFREEGVKESPSDIKIRENVKNSLANEIKEITNNLRKQQKNLFNFLKKLNNEEGGQFLRLSQDKLIQMTDDTVEDAMSEMEMMEGLAKGRDEEINKLVDSINDLTSIFKQMADLVYSQGTLLDRIDFNIEETLNHTKNANKQLDKANEYQKSNLSRNCIMILFTMILVFVIILIIKYSKN